MNFSSPHFLIWILEHLKLHKSFVLHYYGPWCSLLNQEPRTGGVEIVFCNCSSFSHLAPTVLQTISNWLHTGIPFKKKWCWGAASGNSDLIYPGMVLKKPRVNWWEVQTDSHGSIPQAKTYKTPSSLIPTPKHVPQCQSNIADVKSLQVQTCVFLPSLSSERVQEQLLSHISQYCLH